ncbi:hypothetical protein GU926_10870 [Nibribacter ruber]|uniref:Uncharacterized protein n=1 Tax=Nibribacter ruber TaxID=2698458 RepID=A0A6P1P053_9BACT|nr:hypothetical protein [Nibribacter ruber]QHL87905.1 hypothetical protein GU926_10870 [Nibribacter ruber]
MKAKLLLPLFLLLGALSATAQTKPATYRLSSQIETQIKTDTVPWKHQKGAWEYSFGGHYLQALQAWDAQYPTMRRQVTAQDSTLFKTHAPSPAKAYLVEKAKKHQLFVINEAHHTAEHRAFTQSLLADLYKQGYRYLGLEALDQTDSLINQRQYPVQESGYYTKEPQMGSLVREALRLGYTVFGYDAEGNGKEREINQARNIQKMLQKDPKAKMVIHCGFDHVNEGPSQAWEKAMAGRLKEFTGLDPFTVDQESLTPTSAPRFDEPFLQLSNAPYPAVYLQKDTKQPFTGSGSQRTVDVVVVHPKTKLVKGRPGWVWLKDRKPYKLSARKITIGYPALVLAYKQSEAGKAVPMDIIEIRKAQNMPALALPKGEYRLVLQNGAGQQQTLPIQVK